MKISVIIPILNEAKFIGKLIEQLQEHGKDYLLEIIVVDGGSKDNSKAIAESYKVVVLDAPECGRAIQMNYGASHAKGEILYFVHADTLPPKTYGEDILKSLEEGFELGCFRFKFDSDKWILKVNGFFTRFDKIWCRGGDQTLYIRRSIFEAMGGYGKEYLIMEEYDFILRAKEKYRFKIIPKNALVSARKYEQNSYLRVQLTHLILFNMFRMGCSQEKMLTTYKKLLHF